MLRLIHQILGFDPLALAGVPNGFELLYLLSAALLLSLAVPLGIWIGHRRKPMKARAGLLAITLLCVFGLMIVSESLFVEFIDQGNELRGTPASKNLIVPLPIVASSVFRDYVPGGRYYKITRGIELREHAFAPSDSLATYTTVLLHMLLLLGSLGGFFAGIVSAIMAMVSYLKATERNTGGSK